MNNEIQVNVHLHTMQPTDIDTHVYRRDDSITPDFATVNIGSGRDRPYGVTLFISSESIHVAEEIRDALSDMIEQVTEGVRVDE